MKAIILAGGRGSRLAPLTNNTPKPLIKIIDKPVMYHIITLLAKHGIRDIGVTLGYMAESIMEEFGDGSDMGVKLTYFVERQPLGTAGSIKACKKFITSDTIIMSGDAYTNIDLSEAIAFHEAKQSKFTMIATPHSNPIGLGVLKINHDNLVTNFIEKPAVSEASLINCGIYIISPEVVEIIPEGKYDFGKDLIPRLLGQSYAYVTYKYWSDIGTLSSY